MREASFPSPTLEDLAAGWREAVAEEDRRSRWLDEIEEESPRAEERLVEANRREDQARVAFAVAVLVSEGVIVPDLARWGARNVPLAVVRIGRSTFAVLPGDPRLDMPATLAEMAKDCLVVAIDDPEDEATQGEIPPEPRRNCDEVASVAPGVIDPGPHPDEFRPWPDPMTRDEARGVILDEVQGACLETLDAFVHARATREASLAYARLHGLEGEMRPQLRVLAELEQKATRAAALGIVCADPKIVPPRPDTPANLWPTRAVIRRGCVFIGGAFFHNGEYRVGVESVCPGAVIDLDAQHKARMEETAARRDKEQERPEPTVPLQVVPDAETTPEEGVPSKGVPEGKDVPRDFRHEVIIRALGRWEQARAALQDIEEAEGLSGEPLNAARFDAKQMEASAGERIDDLSGIVPPFRESDEPLGVRLGGMTYFLVADPVSNIGSDDPIVLRVASDRIVDLDGRDDPAGRLFLAAIACYEAARRAALDVGDEDGHLEAGAATFAADARFALAILMDERFDAVGPAITPRKRHPMWVPPDWDYYGVSAGGRAYILTSTDSGDHAGMIAACDLARIIDLEA